MLKHRNGYIIFFIKEKYKSLVPFVLNSTVKRNVKVDNNGGRFVK